jgi:hypothetical protein
MITAETILLDSNTQAQIADILEMELSYLKNELSTTSTQAAIIAGTAFGCLCVPQLDGYGAQRAVGPGGDPSDQPVIPGIALDGLRGWWHTLYVGLYIQMASLTITLSALTICSAMFLYMWGSNEALRCETIEALRDTVSSVRSERIFTLRLFTLSIGSLLATLCLLAWVNWNEWASLICTFNVIVGLCSMRWMYIRTINKFSHTPVLFGEQERLIQKDYSQFSHMNLCHYGANQSVVGEQQGNFGNMHSASTASIADLNIDGANKPSYDM